MKALVTMRDALADPQLLGGALPGDSWRPHRVLLIAAMGEELDHQEREIFAQLTGREQEPLQRVDEYWGILGRRSGKTRAAGVLGAYVAGLCSHDDDLAPGERGVLPILAASVTQASRAYMHVRGVFEESPVLQGLLDGEPTSGTIRLTTRVDVETRPASFRTIRGVTAVAAICDEVAFWLVEGTGNPDTEILNALRPALATTQGPLWVISSPYAKRGELYETWRKHWGPDGDPLILVARAASRVMNSTLSQALVDRAYERDAAAAAAEYGAEFRSDLEAFVSREIVEACVARGVVERAPVHGVAYRAFVDPSGGGADAMTLAIGHEEEGRAVVDALRSRRPPFSPEGVVAEYAALLRTYGISEVKGDRYAGQWPREAFSRHGVTYVLAEQPKSQLYQDMLPVLNSGRLDLVDVPEVVAEISALERRVARGGRESIDHPPHLHDDLANAVAGLVGMCIRAPEAPCAAFGTYGYGTRAPSNDDYEVPPPAWLTQPGRETELRDYLERRRNKNWNWP